MINDLKRCFIGQRRSHYSQLTRGEAATSAVRVALERFQEWPARPTRALQDGTFRSSHARLINVRELVIKSNVSVPF